MTFRWQRRPAVIAFQPLIQIKVQTRARTDHPPCFRSCCVRHSSRRAMRAVYPEPGWQPTQ